MSDNSNKIKFNIFKESIVFRISAYLMVFCLVMMLVSFLYVRHSNQKQYVFSQRGGFLYDDQPCYATLEIPLKPDGRKNFWQEHNLDYGAQYDIYLYNNSNKILGDYYLEMKVADDARIDSSWNGEYTLENGIITMIPREGLNTVAILPKENAKYGFILYAKQLMGYADFKIYCHFKTRLIDSPFFLVFLILFLVCVVTNLSAFFSYISIRKEKKRLIEQTEAVIKLCANFIDTRDKYTKQHSVHVAEYSRMIAKELKLSEEEQRYIYYDGMMHDVGKVLISTEYLCKAGKLYGIEWEEMKKHTVYGAGVIQDFDAIPHLKDAILYHHERYDGKGYMSGLIGEAIPLVARIIAVADAFDAMATNRSYRQHLSKEIIINELKTCSGTQFDPKIADIMIRLIENNKVFISE